ncbi:MAG: hypothetical protein JNK04_24545 [Myxococcales bacterium]|nr:hypothetical protein [Myxococcales bacterium]
MNEGEVRVRGVLITRQRELLRRAAGARYAIALSRVPAAAREDYDSAGILSWCGQSSARAVTTAVAVELGQSPIELVRHIVEVSTREALQGPWAILLGMMTDDHAILRRASKIFEKAFDRGTLSATLLGDGTTRVTLEGWPNAHAMDIESIACGMETLLDVLGRACTVSSTRRGPVIEYIVKSEPRRSPGALPDR